jgi:hypothetical protein
MYSRTIATLAIASVLVAGASAQTYYLRGDFNGWPGEEGQAMTDNGDGTHSGTITGLTPGERAEFKVTTDTGWDPAFPDGNASGIVKADGTVSVTFFDNEAPEDGWMPNGRRVGVDDADDYGWEIMGSFNGWSDPLIQLNKIGDGLYSGQAMLDVGSYEFKYRKIDDWDHNVGPSGGKDGDNIMLEVTDPNLPIQFTLDRLAGRHTVEAVPEPATMLVLGAGLAALAARRRKK